MTASGGRRSRYELGPPATTPAKLVVDSVTKHYGDRTVLDGISLEVREHEVVCLIGSSGSGKSTLLRCIDLLDPIESGRILLDGEEITDRRTNANGVRRRIGIVFQSYNLFPHSRCSTTSRWDRGAPRGIERRVAEERALEILSRLGCRPRVEVPRAALGWSAAAGRDRPGARG